MKKDKKYDAVKEMREVREKLSLEFWNNPEKMKEVLKAAREKFLPKDKGTKPV